MWPELAVQKTAYSRNAIKMDGPLESILVPKSCLSLQSNSKCTQNVEGK